MSRVGRSFLYKLWMLQKLSIYRIDFCCAKAKSRSSLDRGPRSPKKRLFCLFQRDYKYTLTIEYYNPETNWHAMPTVPFGGVSFNSYTTFESSITMRYKTEKECMWVMHKIQAKQKILDEHMASITKELEQKLYES